jgi:predicted MFS family arabinose efflux permease
MRDFLIKFVALSIVSGTTIGINKILITLFGLSLNASNWQLGLIGAAETLGLALGTLPAGVLVSRGNPRALYGLASAILAGAYLVIPHLRPWLLLLPVMTFTGFCIAFRIVSMSSIFLHRVGDLGPAWAGWYKGTLALGTSAIGPWAGEQLTRRLGLPPTFVVAAGLFLFMATLGVLALPRPTVAASKPRRDGHWLLPIWRDRQVRWACLMEGLSGFSAALFSTFMLVVLMRDHAWPRERAVAVLVLYGTTSVAVLLFAGWVLAKVKRDRLDRVVYGALALALGGLGLSQRPFVIVLWTAVFALGIGFNNLVNITAISESRCDRGHVSGVSTLMQMSGGCLGAFLGGLLARWFSLQFVFVLFAAPWVLAFLRRPSPAHQVPREWQSTALGQE